MSYIDPIIAGVKIGRLDERLHARGNDAPEKEWFIRKEAMAIASREGRLTDEIRYCGYVEEVSNEAVDQSVRLSADIATALRIVLKWENTPTAAELRSIWDASNKSNLMILGADRQWQLDTAFEETAELLDLMLTDPSLDKTEHILHTIWTTKGFGQASRRMALLLSPFVLRKAFAAPHLLLGIAKYYALPVDVFDEPTRDERIQDLLYALSKGSEHSLEASLKIARLEQEFATGIASRRGSGMERSIPRIISSPVINATRLADSMQVTHKGAIVILERFEEAGILSKLDPTSPRTRSYICHKAINL